MVAGFALILAGAISMLFRKIVDVYGPPEMHSSQRGPAGTEL